MAASFSSATSLSVQELRDHLSQLYDEESRDELIELFLSLLLKVHRDKERLEKRLRTLLRGKKGGASEKLSPEQLLLFLDQLSEEDKLEGLEEEDEDESEDSSDDNEEPPEDDGGTPAEANADTDAESSAEADAKPPPKKPKGKGKGGRRKLPDDLQMREIVVPLPDPTCPCCQQPWRVIGYEQSEVLNYVPGYLEKIVYKREKGVCPSSGCSHRGVSTAPPALKPIEKGLASFGLMADLVGRKYVDHCPTNHVQSIYQRQGVNLSVNTLYGWEDAAADLLQPIAQAIHEQVLAAHVLQVDDTRVRILDRTEATGRRWGHYWAFLGDRRWVSFAYTATWKSEELYPHLEGRTGWLQGDAYAGYSKLTKHQGPMDKVGCWAHARRKFVVALEYGERLAAIPLRLIQKLYRIEQQATKQELPADQRLQLRLKRSMPILEKLLQWIRQVYPNAPPKTELGKAVRYLVNQWDTLKRFLEDGHLQLDNNDCERELRHVCIGRRNWLFSGSDEGARRSAILYTVVRTARLHGLNPVAYLRDVMFKLMNGWPARRLQELLPPYWSPSTDGVLGVSTV